ncbi:hypothetical protein ZIOFF_003331 [Zingiber officinale]|uniref:Uncharacterized protein n=1 Tax=Zingiber officinale TaxID=94328 RepID=A0A8J5ING5_ZINOF|nr:hypothetical protein ZIOFF_003331 [Zingiber officinale]
MYQTNYVLPSIIVVILFLILFRIPITISQERPPIPAVLVFGDSIVDPGNNNMLITPARANFPPYGRDFPGHEPTGRFSNGRIPPDIIGDQEIINSLCISIRHCSDLSLSSHHLYSIAVSLLRIKDLLPPYRAPDLENQELLTGVSFASAASGFDNLTATVPKVFSLWDQLEMYKEYKRKLIAIAGEAAADAIIRESPHVIFSGNNDILTTYFFSTIRQRTFDLPSYINYLVNAAGSFVNELYKLGARRIVVAGVPPLGCVPAARTVGGGENRDCVETYNQASTLFNLELSRSLEQLNVDLFGARIIYLNIYDTVMDLIQHGSDYGKE